MEKNSKTSNNSLIKSKNNNYNKINNKKFNNFDNDTNYEYIDDTNSNFIKKDNNSNFYDKIKPLRKTGINLKSSSIFNKEKYKKIKKINPQIISKEKTLLNTKLRNSPVKFKHINNMHQTKIRSNKIFKPRSARFINYNPNFNYNTNLKLNSNRTTRQYIKPLTDNLNTINNTKELYKIRVKRPICFNDKNPNILYSNNGKNNYSYSYKNNIEKNNIRISPLYKYRFNKSKYLNNGKKYFNDIINRIYSHNIVKDYLAKKNNNERYIRNSPEKEGNPIILKKRYYRHKILEDNNNYNINPDETKNIKYNNQKENINNTLNKKNYYKISKEKNNFNKDNKLRRISSNKIMRRNNNYILYMNNRNNLREYNKINSLNLAHNFIKGENIKEKENLNSLNSLTKSNTENNFEKLDDIYPIENNFKHISTLSPKINLDEDISINNNYNKLKLNQNIEISSETIFTIYWHSNKIYILCFDFENKEFSIRDFIDYGKFEENYLLSLKTKTNINKDYDKIGGNLFLSKYPYLYIITGKNYDILYVYDSINKTMNKLCNLKNNHSNGALIYLNKNSLLCISGDFNKKVELYSISKNEWKNYLPETLIERSNFPFCIIKERYIFLIFGKNYPTKEYLNTIEYYDLKSNDISNGWKYLNIKNKTNLIKMNICNGCGINFNDKKIVIFGGYNGLENKNEKYFIQISFPYKDSLEYNFNSAIIERTSIKLKDIDKNKKYYFNSESNIIIEKKDILKKDKIIYYASFDNMFNCHFIQVYNLAHEIYYNV